MRILIWCDTYYQLISAVHMSRTIFRDNLVDVVLSDHSLGAEEVARRLRETGALNSVTFVKTKNIVYGKNRARKFREIVRAAAGKAFRFTDTGYDEIIFYGLNPWLYEIGDESIRIGKKVRWSRFDEGVLSYSTDYSMGILDWTIEPLRRLYGKYRITKEAKRYYCYFPELKKSSWWNVKGIPSLDRSHTDSIEILKKAFAFKAFPYEQQYIFFASSSDIDGRPFGETDMVLRIADQVGPKNLLVKMHPRDTRDVYRSRGMAVMDNSQIPWEVIQLCAEMEGKTLLTVTSGAFLSVSAMAEGGPRAAFLMPETIEAPWLEERMRTISETVDTLHSFGHAENVECVWPDEMAAYLSESSCEKNGERQAEARGGVIFARVQSKLRYR